MWLSANAPSRFAGIILANTAPNFPPPELWKGRAEAVRTSGMAPFVEPTLDRWFTRAFRETSPKRVAEIGQMLQSTSIEGYAACCDVLAQADMSRQLDRIACPALVIAGQYDPSTPPSRGAEIVSAVAGARMVVLDAAHLSSVEAADAFALAIKDFMVKV
jgi:pimeloyl-ACP methyl ester carboxylesterase